MSNLVPENIPLNNIEFSGYTDSRYWAIFNECDEDKDGYINYRELKSYVKTQDDKCRHIPKKIIKKIINQADTDGDKQLNFEEFVNLIESTDFQDIFQKGVKSYIEFLIPKPKVEASPFRFQSVRIASEEPNLCDEYSCCPPPIFMLLISLIEFALFITDELTQKDSTLTASGVTGQYLLYDPYKKKEFWRFWTYMFVHIGYMHIIMNLIVQLALGIPLEMVNKWWRILSVYFLGGIAGCLAHAIIDGEIRLGGASGGVYALITAHLAQVIMNWKDLPYAYVQFIVFGCIISIDLGSAAYNRYYLKVVNEIGVTCHMGGALAGLLVGIYILRNISVTSTEKYIWWGALIIYLILTITSVLAVIFL